MGVFFAQTMGLDGASLATLFATLEKVASALRLGSAYGLFVPHRPASRPPPFKSLATVIQ